MFGTFISLVEDLHKGFRIADAIDIAVDIATLPWLVRNLDKDSDAHHILCPVMGCINRNRVFQRHGFGSYRIVVSRRSSQ